MKRKTVILISLIAVLLLAGLCACKQEVTPEESIINPGISGVTIPKWEEKSEEGLQNLPDINTSGTETGVTEALVNGLKNPPAFTKAKNLIVMVCEGLTSELIESSAAQYGELILEAFPVKGATTSSKFMNGEGKTLINYIKDDLLKSQTGIVSWGELSSSSMRLMTTNDGSDVSRADVSFNQFKLSRLTMGKGDFSKVDSDMDQLNDIHKARAVITSTLEESIPLYMNEEYHFYFDTAHDDYSAVKKLYTIFAGDGTLPSFRQETAFSLAWMQSKLDNKGFALLMSYSPSAPLDTVGVQNFDEGVAVAVKYVLENPDTVLLICGCPVDGSEADVCFYGLGKDVAAKSTLFECVSSIFAE